MDATSGPSASVKEAVSTGRKFKRRSRIAYED
jgi:hypothetical protein